MAFLWQDTKLAVRNLRRRPGLVATALVSLGLGLGANAAIFSVVDAALFRPLPLAEPERLVVIKDSKNGQVTGGNAARLYDFAEQMSSAAHVAGYFGEGATLTGRGPAQRVEVLRTFGQFLAFLGTAPAMGRPFTAEEERGKGERVVLISNAYFQRERLAIGDSLNLSGTPHTVVGVLPASLTFPEGFDALSPADPELQGRTNRRSRYLAIVARLKPDLALATVNAELAGINARLAAAYPDSDAEGLTSTAVNAQAEMTKEARKPLLFLLGAAGFVLLIACVTISTLLLARAAERRHEAAIRASLGAGVGRLVQLYLVESLVLAVAGGLAGLWTASMLLPLLQQVLPADLPRLAQASLDERVLLFAIGAAVFCGFVFGSLPALQLARAGSLVTSKRSTGRASTFLVAAQMGLSVVLLVAVGLLGRALIAAQQKPLGFVPAAVWTAKVDFPWSTEWPALRSYSRAALERLSALPGIESAGLTDRLPLEGGSQDNPIRVTGQTLTPDQEKISVAMRAVSAEYLSTLRVPLVAGRWFREPAREAVVNQTFVRTFFPEGDAVGRSFSPQRGKTNQSYTITGVVPDIPRETNAARPMPEAFMSSEFLYWPMLRFAVRGRTDAQAIRQTLQSVDANVLVGSVAPMETRLREATGEARTQLSIVFAFAAIALGLAAVGLYGVLSSDVAQRTREMGIRLALGAAPGDLLGQIVGGGLRVTLIGLVPGLIVAMGLAHFLGMNPADGWALSAAVGVLLVVAAVASYLPARRAAKVDPIVALRQD